MIDGADAFCMTLVGLFNREPLPLDNEKVLQAAAHDRMIDAGFFALREVHLSRGSIVDHIVAPSFETLFRIAIECKLSGDRTAILKQCERYLAHDAVSGMVLLTQRAVAAPRMAIPKPFYVTRPSGPGGLS